MKHFDFFKHFNIQTNMAKVQFCLAMKIGNLFFISHLVCPAGWRPGADTIIPNPEEKLKYFSKNYETKKN